MQRKRTIVTLALALTVTSLAASRGAAQAHPGDVLMGGGYPSNSTSYMNGLYRASSTGTFSTFVDTFGAQRPYNFNDVEVGMDNRSIVFGTNGSTSPLYSLTNGIFSYDPVLQQYSTLARSTIDFRIVHGVESDQNGDWYVAASGLDASRRTKYAIYRVRNDGSGYSTVLTTVALGHPQMFSQPIERDVDTGDLLIPGSQSVGFLSRPVYALAHDGSVSTFHASGAGPSPTYGFTQEIETRDLLYVSSRSLSRTPPGRTNTSNAAITGLTPHSAYGAILDNQSAARRELVLYSYRSITTLTEANLSYVDPQTRSVIRTVNFLTANNRALIPYPFATIVHDRSRYIQTVRAGASAYDLQFDVPAHAGKSYVVAAGFSGVRPGIRLGDGRRVWLNFDPLMELTLQNRVPALFNPGPLALDANGRAKGRIDLRAFPLPLGVTIHMVVAVLDPSAPSGIAFVTEPYPLSL